MKVAILFDPGGVHWDQRDIAAAVESVRIVQTCLRRRGHACTLVPIRPGDWRWLTAVRRADVIFNLCEGLDGHSRFEDWVVGTLELCGVPFTGCRAWATAICHRKHVANALLQSENIPVPPFGLARGNTIPDGVGLPAIVKPAAEDASLGVDVGAVCTTAEGLRDRVARMAEQWEDVLVQEYVAGREFNVGFVGRKMLPISEIDFAAMPASRWPIVTYSAKWEEGSEEDRGTIPICPARIDPDLQARLADAARRAWELLTNCEGYGRVDLRVDEAGRPFVLEVNPNADLSVDAGLARMAQAESWDYEELLAQVIRETLDRAASRQAATTLTEPRA